MKINPIYIFIVLLFSGFACTKSDGTLILVSKDPSNSYTNWILSIDSTLTVKDFYSIAVDSMDYYLNASDGIIMTGGEDVNPKIYGKPDYKNLCEAPDDFRDSIEKVMIRYSFKRKIPMIGICRGQQIINAVNGGTLTPDIPTEHPESRITHRSKSDSAHVIVPTVGSWIAIHQGMGTYWVNSRHHQCVDDVARGFQVAAYAPDGIIESIEMADKQLHPFVICVQWHPENLRDSLATALGSLFLGEIGK